MEPPVGTPQAPIVANRSNGVLVIFGVDFQRVVRVVEPTGRWKVSQCEGSHTKLVTHHAALVVNGEFLHCVLRRETRAKGCLETDVQILLHEHKNGHSVQPVGDVGETSAIHILGHRRATVTRNCCAV